jgi:hypothetical protein
MIRGKATSLDFHVNYMLVITTLIFRIIAYYIFIIEYEYIFLNKSLLYVSVRTAPSTGRTSHHLFKKSDFYKVVTFGFVSKFNIYFMR